MSSFWYRIAGVAFALSLTVGTARGDILVNFSDLSLPANPPNPLPPGSTGSYNNGSDLSGGFTSAGTFFNNTFNSTFGSWDGWSYSNVNDTVKTGPSPFPNDFLHQYAAITQTAPGGSGIYAVASGNSFINLPAGFSAASMMVTNTTYDYLSMTLGDSFAGKFVAGNFFELKITGFAGLNATGASVGEVDFFLANYTSNSSLPVNVWSLIDLTPLAGAMSLGFSYDGNVTNQFGITTPFMFAMDDLDLKPTAVPEPASLALIATGLAGLMFKRRRLVHHV
jgi:hypothetical protein